MKTTYKIQIVKRTSNGWNRNYWKTFENYEDAYKLYKITKEDEKTSFCVLYERTENENTVNIERVYSYFKR